MSDVDFKVADTVGVATRVVVFNAVVKVGVMSRGERSTKVEVRGGGVDRNLKLSGSRPLAI